MYRILLIDIILSYLNIVLYPFCDIQTTIYYYIILQSIRPFFFVILSFNFNNYDFCRKSVLFIYSIYLILSVGICISLNDSSIYNIVKIGSSLIILSLLLIYIISRTSTYYNMTNDSIDDNHIYYAYKQPKNYIDMLLCLCFSPASSFAIIMNGYIYYYCKNEIGFQRKKINNEILKKYFIKKTDIFFNKEIESKLQTRLGIPYNLIYSNCVNIYRGILPINSILPCMIH